MPDRLRRRRPARAPASPAARSARARSSRGRPGAAPGRPGRRDRRTRPAGRLSDCSRSAMVSGTLASSGTSSSSASTWPPPSPKIGKRSPPGVTKPDMFSITPAISSLSLAAISAERRATFCATGCGRGDDQELRLRQQLGERHRDVAGAGRQVDQQVVELAPVDVLEELLERLVEHRPAPDDGGVLLDEEPDRHHLDAVLRRAAGPACARALTLGRSAPRPSIRGCE